MPKSGHKALIDSLKARFPHLERKIQESARGIYEAQRLVEAVENGTIKAAKARRSVSNLAKIHAIPSAVAKYFLFALEDPQTVCPMGHAQNIIEDQIGKMVTCSEPGCGRRFRAMVYPYDKPGQALEYFRVERSLRREDYAGYFAAREKLMDLRGLKWDSLSLEQKQEINRSIREILWNPGRYKSTAEYQAMVSAIALFANQGATEAGTKKFVDLMVRRALPLEKVRKPEERRAFKVPIHVEAPPKPRQRREEESEEAEPLRCRMWFEPERVNVGGQAVLKWESNADSSQISDLFTGTIRSTQPGGSLEVSGRHTSRPGIVNIAGHFYRGAEEVKCFADLAVEGREEGGDRGDGGGGRRGGEGGDVLITIKGKVTDEKDKPLAYASVWANYPTTRGRGTTSDDKGNYSFQFYIPGGSPIATEVEADYIGGFGEKVGSRATSTRPITLRPSTTTYTVNFKMEVPLFPGVKTAKQVGQEFKFFFFDPFTSAVNEGKKRLKQEAESHAEKLKEKYKKRSEDITKLVELMRNLANKIKAQNVAQSQSSQLDSMGGLAALAGPEGMAAAAVLQSMGKTAGAKNETKDLGIELQELTEDWKEAHEEARELKEKFADKIREHLRGIAGKVAVESANKYAISERLAEIKEILAGEAEEIGGQYESIEKGPKPRIGTPFSGMNIAQLGGAVLKNFWGLIIGAILAIGVDPSVGLALVVFWGGMKLPWIFSLLIIWIQFAFLLGGTVLFAAPLPGYTSFDTTQAILIAAGAALLNLFFNMRKQRGPLPSISHLLAGLIIGLGALTLILAFQAFGAGGFLFWALVILAIGVAVFQVYFPSGYPDGLRAVNVLAIIVLVFSFFALGPYSGFVVSVTDQIGAPIKAATAQGSLALTDVWLLITNPTEYFAQQQLRNVRPERPISFPKAVEVSRLDAIPGTVPAGERFTLFAAFENQADQDAREVQANAECAFSAPRDVGPCTKVSGAFTGAGRTMRPGQVDRAEWTFTSTGRTGREPGQRVAETVFNTVNLSLSAIYDTSSSLQVELATDAEISRRQTQQGRFYYSESAIGKVSPAQVSISVGPQPLITGRDATSVIAVTNARPDGNVIFLPERTQVIIELSPAVGSGLVCSSQTLGGGNCNKAPSLNAQGNEEYGCVLPTGRQPLLLERYQSRSVIPIFCQFKVAEVAPEVGSRTGLIIAQLKNYRFDLFQEKKIQVTAPLGVLGAPVQQPGAQQPITGGQQQPT